MEFSSIQAQAAAASWPFYLSHPLIFPTSYFPLHNYVHWSETSDSHLFSAELPGVRKEEIRVEVENSRYLIIRTERAEEEPEPSEAERRNFMRKFRLPEMVDVDGISAGYEDGVLTVTVPRSLRRLQLNPADLGGSRDLLAPAA